MQRVSIYFLFYQHWNSGLRWWRIWHFQGGYKKRKKTSGRLPYHQTSHDMNGLLKCRLFILSGNIVYTHRFTLASDQTTGFHFLCGTEPLFQRQWNCDSAISDTWIVIFLGSRYEVTNSNDWLSWFINPVWCPVWAEYFITNVHTHNLTCDSFPFTVWLTKWRKYLYFILSYTTFP